MTKLVEQSQSVITVRALLEVNREDPVNKHLHSQGKFSMNSHTLLAVTFVKRKSVIVPVGRASGDASVGR